MKFLGLVLFLAFFCAAHALTDGSSLVSTCTISSEYNNLYSPKIRLRMTFTGLFNGTVRADKTALSSSVTDYLKYAFVFTNKTSGTPLYPSTVTLVTGTYPSTIDFVFQYHVADVGPVLVTYSELTLQPWTLQVNYTSFSSLSVTCTTSNHNSIFIGGVNGNTGNYYAFIVSARPMVRCDDRTVNVFDQTWFTYSSGSPRVVAFCNGSSNLIPYNAAKTVWYCPANSTAVSTFTSQLIYTVTTGKICDMWDNHTIQGLGSSNANLLTIQMGPPANSDDTSRIAYAYPSAGGVYTKIVMDTHYPVVLSNFTTMRYPVLVYNGGLNVLNCSFSHGSVQDDHLIDITCPISFQVNRASSASLVLVGNRDFLDIPPNRVDSRLGANTDYEGTNTVTVNLIAHDYISVAHKTSDISIRVYYTNYHNARPVTGDYVVYNAKTGVQYTVVTVQRVNSNTFDLLMDQTIPAGDTYLYHWIPLGGISSYQPEVTPIPTQVISGYPTSGDETVNDLPAGQQFVFWFGVVCAAAVTAVLVYIIYNFVTKGKFPYSRI